MEELRIETSQPADKIRPGGQFCGTVHWQLPSEPEKLELVLFWRTEGKGTQDAGVEQVQEFERPGRNGEREFCFTLPAGPYSVSSRFLSVVWAVEASVSPGDVVDRHDFVLSPTGAEIVLMEPL